MSEVELETPLYAHPPATASQSEALVEAMWLHLRAYVTPPPFHHNEEGWRTICRMLLVKAEPIITARIAAAIQADRRGRTFSPTELDHARAEGKREGIEEAAQEALNWLDPIDAAAAIRALAEKRP